MSSVSSPTPPIFYSTLLLTDILPITLAFFSLEFFTTMVACIFALLLNSRKMLHATYKLFLHALGVDLICMLLIWMHYDRYSENGRGFPLFKLIALMLRYWGLKLCPSMKSGNLRQMAIVVFILLLLLVAKGYTITRAKLSTSSVVKLSALTAVLLILHVLMLLWQMTVTSRHS